MVLATNLGFPRIGAKRELKKAVEAYWKGELTQEALIEEGKNLRIRHLEMQKDAGLDHIPSNDFSFYDQVLDMCCLLGCVPSRYKWQGDTVDLDTYFAMARGRQESDHDVTAMEMTKWFDTNYHFIVPEFEEDQTFKLSSTKIFDAYQEAKDIGIETRPVLLGPISFIGLGKARNKAGETFCPRGFLDDVLPVYEEILQKLEEMGASWVQIDEPLLAMDTTEGRRNNYKRIYERLNKATPKLNILLATYFEGLRENQETALSLPVQALHIDLRRDPEQLEEILGNVPSTMSLSLGVVDGRNIWKNDLSASVGLIEEAIVALGEDRVFVAPSCSMLHVPVDLEQETALDPTLKNWMAFARQKLDEIATIAKAAQKGRDVVSLTLEKSDAVVKERKISKRIHNADVKARMAAIDSAMIRRKSNFATRCEVQHNSLDLPLYPTTTIGSFPQTKEIRAARASYKKGLLNEASYEEAMKREIRDVVAFQESIGMDVLVHGEPERNDMVEYFGEQLEGFTFTKFGWVQSYGSRCVKPPIIFGDVSRPTPMTVNWSKYAQSLTEKPMKGMLTGPITILCWSFVRDDQPRSETCMQIGLAIRDEVTDLEKAGIKVIQIDEPAIREGLPLRRDDWGEYLKWAVESFKLSSCGVEDSTQIHTHMCYSEFNDIIDSIGALDADVISIETSRSQMELLDAFVTYKYPNEIGPGVYDIHSPRVPSVKEMVHLLEKARDVLNEDQIWVNPDCGLKTRAWPETKEALKNMVDAAKEMRGE